LDIVSKDGKTKPVDVSLTKTAVQEKGFSLVGQIWEIV
jgi:hypothetical protein